MPLESAPTKAFRPVDRQDSEVSPKGVCCPGSSSAINRLVDPDTGTALRRQMAPGGSR